MENKERKKVFIQKRKLNGLCVNCGIKLDREGIYCKKCREKINKNETATRKWYQENGICPRCRKNKLFGDEKNCIECVSYSYTLIMPKREMNREHYNQMHREWSKRTHQEMIENGICTRCRKRKADYGYKTCGICRDKNRKYKQSKSNKIDRKERVKCGLCYFCDNPIKEGYKVCEKHYQINLEKARSEKAAVAREKLKKEGILY